MRRYAMPLMVAVVAAFMGCGAAESSLPTVVTADDAQALMQEEQSVEAQEWAQRRQNSY
jgi:hypothetical protein